MAAKPSIVFVTISLHLFLFLIALFSSTTSGAIYRLHTSRHDFPPTTFAVLPKGSPIPPSGPSKRHNDYGPDAPEKDGGSGGGGSGSGGVSPWVLQEVACKTLIREIVIMYHHVHAMVISVCLGKETQGFVILEFKLLLSFLHFSLFFSEIFSSTFCNRWICFNDFHHYEK